MFKCVEIIRVGDIKKIHQIELIPHGQMVAASDRLPSPFPCPIHLLAENSNPNRRLKETVPVSGSAQGLVGNNSSVVSIIM